MLPATATPAGAAGEWRQLEAVAVACRRCTIWLVACYLAFATTVGEAALFANSTSGPPIAVLMFLLFCAAMVFLIAAAHQLGAAMGMRRGELWRFVLGIGNPYLIVRVLMLCRTWCRRRGVEVGFFGPTTAAIKGIRRRLSQATVAPTEAQVP